MKRWVKHALPWVLAVAIGGLTTARADDCTKAHAAKAGQPAACTGLLLPRADAAKAAACLKVDLPTCQATAERDRQAAAARQADLKRQAQAERDRANLLDAQLVKLAQTDPPELPVWRRAEFWGPVGAVLGIAAAVAVYELLVVNR